MRRLPSGGRIDRSRPLRFHWDDRELVGFAGDTLASALLGSGVAVLGQSLSFGRPRGVMSAGLEEAHGFAQVGEGGRSEPLVRTTSVRLVDGLRARSRIGKGFLPNEADSARFERRWAHCDLLVVGGGRAGLEAAREAARSDARVILVEDDWELGGRRSADLGSIEDRPALQWIAEVAAELAAKPDVTILTHTTAAIALDQNGIILIERVGSRVEQRLWQVRAGSIVLATGTLERPIIFPDNDRPGIMLARAARTYLRRFAVAPEKGVVFTTHDDGYRTALAWHEAGVPVEAIVDPRPEPLGPLAKAARDAGLPLLTGSVVDGTEAGPDGRLRAARITGPSGSRPVECDLLAVSGGFDPSLGLHLQRRGPTRWDDARLAIVSDGALPRWRVVGSALGAIDLGPNPSALWWVPAPDGDESRSFVDPHRDATRAGLERALGAGLRHVEHVKRYTLIGTGVEQGRVAKVNTGALTAEATGRPRPEIGTSSARPPSEPVLFHALAGRAKGQLYEPVRTTSIQPSHQAQGAVFERVGQWLRPRYFPQPGETMAQATERECRAVRDRVGMMDVSTLGKIEVQGPDAASFLDRLYLNTMSTLEPGKARYGVMCRTDGTVFDDGVVIRLEDHRFFVTTTTGNAAAVLDWMEEWLQTEWTELAVWAESVTEQWATVAIAGPEARSVLARVAPGLDLSASAFPFMTVRRATVAGIPDAPIARISFSGELAYEVSVPSPLGSALWNAIAEAGRPHGITPYGMETLHVLRAEKGYFIVGQETDALTTPADLGLGRMVARKDSVGKRSLARPAATRPGRLQLVGFLPQDPNALVPEGAALVADPSEPPPRAIHGHVTASHRSPALGRTFGLAMVRDGSRRHGQTLSVLAGGRSWPVTLCDSVLYDPANQKRDGRPAEAPPGRAPIPSPTRREPLEEWSPAMARLSSSRARLEPIPFLAQTSLRVRSSGRSRTEAALEHPLPGVTQVVTTRFGDLLGLGPDEWLLVGTDGTEAETVAALGRAVGEDGAVVDLSAARTGLLLAGPAAREVLATCCPLDLHLKVFGPGRCAGTVIAKAPVILQALEQPAGYRILVRPSFAAYVVGWLIEGLESIRDLR